MASELKKAQTAITRDCGTVAREEHAITAKEATGGDGRYSGFGAAGKLGVRAKTVGEGGVDIIPKGVWKVAETGVDPHNQPKRKWHHPGTSQGNKAWSRAETATVARLDETIPRTLDAAAERGFRG